jgi:hypothetical protein
MRYLPLTRFLTSRPTGDVRMSFADIERLIGRPLPPSARRHQAWWANTDTHSHASAWLAVGWRTHDLDLAGEAVAFAKRTPARARRAREGARDEGKAAPEAITVRRDSLSPSALRLMERAAADEGCSKGDAVAALVNRLAMERKRRLFDRFPFAGDRSTIDSVDLIREDRDGR